MSCYRGGDGNGRRTRLAPRARPSRCRTCDGGRAEETRHLNPKLNEVLHQDFADCSTLAGALSGQDAAIFCLGAYTGAVPDIELHKVTVDYTIAFARVLSTASPTVAFSFLSGSGADPSGRSRLAFARYKGEAEKALLGAGFSRVYIFRPAYIYPVEPREEPNFGYRLYAESTRRFGCCSPIR